MTIYNKHIRRSDDESVACKVKVTSYNTTGEVTINDTEITMNIDGTKSTFDLSAAGYDTLGEFVDGINAVADMEAVIVDGLRSMDVKADVFDMVGPAGTLTGDETMGCTASDGVSFGWDSSVTHQRVVSIQMEDLPSKAGVGGSASQWEVEDNAVENQLYELKAKLTDTNCTNTMFIYRCHGTTETLIRTITGNATSDEQTFVDENDGIVPITGGDPQVGGRLVCVLTCDTTESTTWIEAKGRSVNQARQAMDY